MNYSVASVYPGGVLFRRPVAGDIDDWSPDGDYGPHPSHLDVDTSEKANEAAAIDVPLINAIASTPEVEGLAVADTPQALVLTDRDVEIFSFLARHRMATYAQLARAFDTSVNALRQRLPRLRVAGYLDKRSPGAPAFAVWLVADQGLQLTGLDLPVATFTTVYEHTLGLTDLSITYRQRGVLVRTETEIRAEEIKRRRKAKSSRWAAQSSAVAPVPPPFVSPQMGDGHHGPDMVLYYPTSTPGRFRCVAVEYELSRKGPKRLRPILRAYRQSSGIHEVRYYTPSRKTAKGIAAAAHAVGAAHMVSIKKFPPSGQ